MEEPNDLMAVGTFLSDPGQCFFATDVWDCCPLSVRSSLSIANNLSMSAYAYALTLNTSL